MAETQSNQRKSVRNGAVRGGQPGNKNAAHAKPWGEALRYALAHHTDDQVKRGEALRKIAAKVVAQALTGDERAIKEIGDRMDGKATIVVAGDESAPLTVLFPDPTNRPPGYERKRIVG